MNKKWSYLVNHYVEYVHYIVTQYINTNFDHMVGPLLIYKQVHAYFDHCLNGNEKNYVRQMMACHPKILLLTENI